MEKEIKIIEDVVRKFYSEAINDILLGYHFRKVSTSSNKNSKIESNLGEFEHHIPNVVNFWAKQLVPGVKIDSNRPNVLKIHEYLNIRKGELDRWITLFKQTLENSSLEEEFKKRWLDKVQIFHTSFNKHFF